jgi:L-alanine-DL-glutamate epimerase-like enolase superfamily enzyme
LKISDVTPFLLRGNEQYGVGSDAAEATDQGDWLLLVRVRTDDGLEGWADVETLGPVAERVFDGKGMDALGFRTLSEQLIGRDPCDAERLWEELYIATAYYGRRGVAMHCISAVDNCLWSIKAQAAGVDLSSALGTRHRDNLLAYASTLFRNDPESNRRAAANYAQLGFRGVKFGWGGFGLDDARDRDNLAAIHEALGAERSLMVDPGWYVEDEQGPRVRTRDETVAMLATLSEFETYWIEDFCHPECPAAYRELKADFPNLRFAAGEQQATVWDFDRLIHDGEVDVLQPDLSRCGGLTVARQVADRARASATEIVTHSWLTDLLHAYSLHYLASLPEARWFEFNVAQSELSRGVTASRLRLAEDGTVPVPVGAGLGVQIDEDFIRSRHAATARP